MSRVFRLSASNSPPSLVKFSEACSTLGLSRYHVNELRKSGKLRTVVIGRNYFIPVADVAAFLALL